MAVRRLISAISALHYFFAAGATWAAGLEDAIPNCPRWLAAADSFLDECKAHARHYTTTFYPSGGTRGEKEEHSAWFASAPADSHFLMGCTLEADRSLRFLGLYYTAEPSAIAVANTAPIIGISFDGDVVLSVDGHPVTLLAVRPFDTAKIKTQWSGGRAALNCQSPRGQDGGFHLKGRNIYADFSSFDREGIAAISGFPTAMGVFEYFEYFPSTLPREVIYASFPSVLVMTSGAVLVRKDSFMKACLQGIADRVATSPLLIHQLCRIAGVTREQ
jgi:hypothetical protein